MALLLPNIEDVPFFDGMAVRDSADLGALGAPGRGSGVVSGMAVTQDTGADMKIAVASGVVTVGGTSFTYSGTGSPFTVAAANTGDRRDAVIYRVGTGVMVLQGTPCPVGGWAHGSGVNPPVKPTLTEATDVLLAELYVASTTTTIVTASNVVDKRMIVAPAPAQTVTQIAAQVLGTAVASVTFSSIPGTYNHLQLAATARSAFSSTVADAFNVTVNGLSTGYDEVVTQNNGTAVSAGQAYNAASWQEGLDLAAAHNTANVYSHLDLMFYRYTNTGSWKTVDWSSGFTDTSSGTGPPMVIRGAVQQRATAAITSITVNTGNATNLVIGSAFYLYGIT
jgi:hypothetical protein